MNKPGVVLISTLLIVMVMAIISTQISKIFFLSIQRDSYIDFKNHSLQLLLSSEKEAIQSIQKEIVSSNQKLTNKNPVLNQSYFFSNELATIQVDVSDASNCFNLNSIFIKTGDGLQIKKDNKEWLERLLRLKGFEAPKIESFIDQLIDWVDPDNQPLNFGAENYFYIGPLSPINQYTPKRLLSNLSEIKNFCTTKFGVEFEIMEKVHAKGNTTEPYTTLNKVEPAGDVEWNFEKFLIGKDSNVIARFKPGVKPMDDNLIAAIEVALDS